MTDTVVTLARGWIGTPYVHQASCKGAGTDCLGLIRGIWREFYGQEPEDSPPYTADWGETSGYEVLMAAAQRHLQPVPKVEPMQAGQVLLFRMHQAAIAKHLGILSASGDVPRFIHAYDGHGVIESPLSGAWARRIAARFRFP